MRNKILFPIVVVIVGLLAVGVYIVVRATAQEQPLVLSGTIEATETNLPTLLGGRVKQVYVDEGEQVRKGQPLALIYSPAGSSSENIISPIEGVVLERLVEPEEYAAPGSTLLVLAPIDQLTLKIYAPENRYGQFSLGQVLPVAVDSFPGETFAARVSHISDKAEFTPRNIETKDSRETTVYAISLDLAASGGKLKPGMPADVTVR